MAIDCGSRGLLSWWVWVLVWNVAEGGESNFHIATTSTVNAVLCFYCHHQLSLDGGSKSTFPSSLGWTWLEYKLRSFRRSRLRLLYRTPNPTVQERKKQYFGKNVGGRLAKSLRDLFFVTSYFVLEKFGLIRQKLCYLHFPRMYFTEAYITNTYVTVLRLLDFFYVTRYLKKTHEVFLL